MNFNILIEKVLSKSGAYKYPESKEEALQGIALSQSTKDTLHTLKSALEWLNLSEDLVNDYRKEIKRKDAQIYKLSVENSKLRTRANLADQRTKNITEYIELHKNKTT